MKKIVIVQILLYQLLANASSQSYQKSVEILNSTNKNSKSAQIKIDNLDKKTKSLSYEYKLLLSQITNQEKYNKILEEIKSSQEDEIISIDNQIQSVDKTEVQLLPLMSDMIDSLEDFIKEDIPFLLEIRLKRISKLKTNLKRADISQSEKYRQILEVYKIEYEYSNAISHYNGELMIDNKNLSVEYLFVGRVSFLYKTLDNKFCGVYSKKEGTFIKLDNDNIPKINKILALSKKQTIPKLLDVPLSQVDFSIVKKDIK